jgi:putative peptide zinc metalloprotease protein
MFIASVSTLVFNANPLLKYDGYFILSDLLEIPNLSQRANWQLRHLWEHHVFGVKDSRGPARSRREAAWLVIYAITSGIYRVIVFAGVLFVVADRFLILGLLMALVCLISWVTVPVGRFAHYLSASPQLARVRGRAMAVTGGLAAAIIILLCVIPFPHHFRAPGVAEARQRSDVVNDVAGVVVQLAAVPGATVAAGQPLMRLENPQLELELADARARYQETEARLRLALSSTNGEVKPLVRRLESVSNLLANLNADEAALTITARHAGIWVAPYAADSLGRRFERGTPQGLLVDPRSFEFVATVRQSDADAAFARQPGHGQVRLWGEADKVLSVSNWVVVPAGKQDLPSPALGQVAGGDVPVSRRDPTKAVEPFFEIHAELVPAAGVTLLHGRSGVIRFDLEPEPLLPRWLRSLRQLLQRRYRL